MVRCRAMVSPYRGFSITLGRRPLPDNTQHSQDTNILALCGIRTHSPSKRAAADACRRPRDHWDRRNTGTKSVSHCHFVHHDPGWNGSFRGNRPGTNRLSHGHGPLDARSPGRPVFLNLCETAAR
jgi:hypothetical protein